MSTMNSNPINIGADFSQIISNVHVGWKLNQAPEVITDRRSILVEWSETLPFNTLWGVCSSIKDAAGNDITPNLDRTDSTMLLKIKDAFGWKEVPKLIDCTNFTNDTQMVTAVRYNIIILENGSTCCLFSK